MPTQAPAIAVSTEKLAQFCRKWRISELSLFGSALRTDFRPDSDIDLLADFEPDARWNLWHYMDMRDELAGIFGRPVDLVSRRALKDPFRRHAILTTRQVIYAA